MLARATAADEGTGNPGYERTEDDSEDDYFDGHDLPDFELYVEITQVTLDLAASRSLDIFGINATGGTGTTHQRRQQHLCTCTCLRCIPGTYFRVSQATPGVQPLPHIQLVPRWVPSQCVGYPEFAPVPSLVVQSSDGSTSTHMASLVGMWFDC